MLNGANPAGTRDPQMRRHRYRLSWCRIYRCCRSRSWPRRAWSVAPRGADGQPVVRRPVELLSTMSCAAVALTPRPMRRPAVRGHEDKAGRLSLHQKAARAVVHDTGGVDGAVPFADGGTVAWSRSGAIAAVHGGEAGPAIGHPERAARRSGESPGFTMFGSAKSARPGWSATRCGPGRHCRTKRRRPVALLPGAPS